MDDAPRFDPVTEAASAGRLAELTGLLALARDLLQIEDYADLLDVVVQRALALLDADRGFLVLSECGSLRYRVVRNWNRAELEGAEDVVSRTIVERVLAKGRPLLVPDAMADLTFAAMASVQEHGVRSVLAAPLLVDGSAVGVLYLENRRGDRFFDEASRALFTEVMDLAGRALGAATHRLALEERTRLLEKDLLARHRFEGIVTRDARFLRLLETVAQVATSEVPVLVQGPSGSGKELIVRALVANGPRAHRPFVTLNCAAIAPTLLESELFGHVRGAFTNALQDKLGLLAAADGGTLFLDEVGELDKELQAKLLRAVQFGEITPVGGVKPRIVDVRYVAATNRDLASDVASGRFREDLYYRLSTVTLALPPLCDRPDDILPLFHHFLGREAARAARKPLEVSPRVERALLAYAWPGNVRDLENEARRAVAMLPDGVPLTLDRLSPRIAAVMAPAEPTPASLEDLEREHVELHLRCAGGNKSHAARGLGISREGLRKKMKRLGLG